MKMLNFVLFVLLLTESIAFAAIQDRIIPSRGASGKVILAPKDGSGNRVQLLEVSQPDNHVLIPVGTPLKVDELSKTAAPGLFTIPATLQGGPSPGQSWEIITSGEEVFFKQLNTTDPKLFNICTKVSAVEKCIQIDGDALIAERVENAAGDSPPGMIPVGGMVAVMPTIDAANAWQPPAVAAVGAAAIKDGFMRADGDQITAAHVSAGCLIALGTYLPNMTGMTTRGSPISCDGTSACQTKSGGDDTLQENALPSSSVVFSNMGTALNSTHTTSDVSGTIGGVGNGLHTHGYADGGHNHTFGSSSLTFANPGGEEWRPVAGNKFQTSNDFINITINNVNSDHFHSENLTAAAQTHVSAATVSGTVATIGGAETATGNVSNYALVVWVIRVY